MNRTVKFRAWDKDGKEMFEVGQLWFPVGRDIIVCGRGGCLTGRDLVLMQYTGLADKNGKEIYEGDVIREGSEIGGVEYFRTRFIVRGVTNWPPSEQSEVIGNIYENPDPLRGERQ